MKIIRRCVTGMIRAGGTGIFPARFEMCAKKVRSGDGHVISLRNEVRDKWS